MSKILVTGGCGFIGSNLVAELLAQNHEVFVIDALKIGSNLKNLPSNPNLNFYKIDLCDLENLKKFFKKHNDISHVYHLASESHVDRSIDSSLPFTMSNCVGTDNLFNCIRKYLPNVEKILLFSTDEVLGALSNEDRGWVETDSIMPRNPYSSGKAFQEHLARSFINTYKMPFVITRCSNIYGKNQYPEKLLPVVINSLRDGRKVPVYGDGQQMREWTEVSDAVSAAIFVMEKGVIGETYHMGSEIEKVNIDVVKFICRFMHKNFDKSVEYVADRLGHDKRYSLDTSKLKNLGWSPLVSFEEGMNQTIKWYLDNPDHWNN